MKIALSVIVLVAVAVAVLIAWDVAQDRRHTLTITEDALLLPEAPLDCAPERQRAIAILSPSDHPRVLRVRYGKDCQLVGVETSSGQVGWLLTNRAVHLEVP